MPRHSRNIRLHQHNTDLKVGDSKTEEHSKSPASAAKMLVEEEPDHHLETQKIMAQHMKKVMNIYGSHMLLPKVYKPIN